MKKTKMKQLLGIAVYFIALHSINEQMNVNETNSENENEKCQ